MQVSRYNLKESSRRFTWVSFLADTYASISAFDLHDLAFVSSTFCLFCLDLEMAMSTVVVAAHSSAPAVLDQDIQRMGRLYVGNFRANRPPASSAVYASHYTSVCFSPP